jgi:hypothetical protein
MKRRKLWILSLLGFMSLWQKRIQKKLLRRSWRVCLEDSDDSDSYDVESGDENSENRPWRPSHTIFEKSTIK